MLPAKALELTSPQFANGAYVAAAQLYTACGGADLSPALAWRDAPAGTKSFAVTLFDPDAQGGWWHWVVYNLSESTTGLAEGGALPAGAKASANDFGHARYDGPCPPPGSGPHHYQLTLWALPQATLPLENAASPAYIGAFLEAHALSRATITAVYERP